ncbi:MAG: fumarate hydratase C-terminal domain-containing protein [Thermoplasmata archaeon]|nr:MAG: fumarate hydratase C-terminal domain-containing protein [Thermoplasmata archaeon]
MSEYSLDLPLTEDAVRKLQVGDSVVLNGEFYTARDEAHSHALDHFQKNEPLPVDLNGAAVFHCGPIVKKLDGDKWELVAAGPTTSSRMNTLEPQFIESFKVRAIIGKGGMSKPTVEAMQKFGCVYLALTGGAALIAAKGVKQVKTVHWFELGMPEALWVLEADKFGPLTVAIDSHGNSLYENIDEIVSKQLPKIKQKLGLE